MLPCSMPRGVECRRPVPDGSWVERRCVRDKRVLADRLAAMRLTPHRARARLARDRNRLEARRNALVPRRADPWIAIFARRELVRPDPGANSLLPLEVIEAETIRKGEVARRHRLIDRDGDDRGCPLRSQSCLSTIDEANPRCVGR